MPVFVFFFLMCMLYGNGIQVSYFSIGRDWRLAIPGKIAIWPQESLGDTLAAQEADQMKQVKTESRQLCLFCDLLEETEVTSQLLIKETETGPPTGTEIRERGVTQP